MFLNDWSVSVTIHSMSSRRNSLSGKLHSLRMSVHSLSVSMSELLEYRRKLRVIVRQTANARQRKN
jgi:hypothetical protein